MEFPPINKFEKERRVIDLHLEGKTIKEIAKEVFICHLDISNIITNLDIHKEVTETDLFR